MFVYISEDYSFLLIKKKKDDSFFLQKKKKDDSFCLNLGYIIPKNYKKIKQIKSNRSKPRCRENTISFFVFVFVILYEKTNSVDIEFVILYY